MVVVSERGKRIAPPNSKSQIPNSKQIPSSKLQTKSKFPVTKAIGRRYGDWNLEFGHCLEFVIWNLELLSRIARAPSAESTNCTCDISGRTLSGSRCR